MNSREHNSKWLCIPARLSYSAQLPRRRGPQGGMNKERTGSQAEGKSYYRGGLIRDKSNEGGRCSLRTFFLDSRGRVAGT